MDLTTFVLATLAVTVGGAVQGSVGFGLGMFGSPMLMLIMPDFVPAPLLLAAMFLTVVMTHRERRSVEFGHLKWAIPGRLIGTIAAVAALAVVSADQMGFGFGVLVLVAVAMSASGLRPSLTPRSLFVAGNLSGFMSTTISVGAPPMALVYQSSSGPSVRGTLSAFFSVGVVLSLAGLALVGRFGLREVFLAASLLPGTALGFWLSRHAAGWLDRGYTRPAVLILSAAGGVGVIVRQIL